MPKLSEKDLANIRKQLEGGSTPTDLAKIYGVSRARISQIRTDMRKAGERPRIPTAKPKKKAAKPKASKHKKPPAKKELARFERVPLNSGRLDESVREVEITLKREWLVPLYTIYFDHDDEPIERILERILDHFFAGHLKYKD